MIVAVSAILSDWLAILLETPVGLRRAFRHYPYKGFGGGTQRFGGFWTASVLNDHIKFGSFDGMELQAAFDLLLSSITPLKAVDGLIWQSLGSGATVPGHPWSHGSLTTLSNSQCDAMSPRSRTVVLRRSDCVARTIDCYTDVRSEKIADLEAAGHSVCWLFYDPLSKIQLRLQGTATVVNNAQADAAWCETSLHSRSAYLSVEPPGKKVAGDAPPSTADRVVNQVDSERGRENFRVIRTQVKEVDWLYLRQGGHVRALLRYLDDGNVDVSWMVP